MADFDFPTGLPRAYARAAGISSFPEFLDAIGAHPWEEFGIVTRHRGEITLRRRRHSGGTSPPHGRPARTGSGGAKRDQGRDPAATGSPAKPKVTAPVVSSCALQVGQRAHDHQDSPARCQTLVPRRRTPRSRRRSVGVVPPQIPWGSPARSAQARQSGATGHRAQMALATATCRTARPDSLTGKNNSGSMLDSRQAARSAQEVLTARPRDRTGPRGLHS
jgi:hypothetical protein